MSIGFNELIASDMLNEGYDCSIGRYKLNDICMDILLTSNEDIFSESAESVSAIDIDFSENGLFMV